MRETEEIFTKTLERHNSRVLLDNQCTPSYSSKSDSDYNSHDNFEINRNKSSTLRRMEVQNNLRSVRQFWRAMEESVSTSASPDVNLNSTSELQNDMKDQKSLEKLSIESDSDEHEDQSLEKIKETFGTKKKFSLSFPSIAFEISNEDSSSSSILRKRKSNSIIGIEKPDFLKESQASALEFYDSTVPLIQPSNLDWKVEIGFRSALNLDIEAGLESSERYDTFYSGVFYGKEHINYLGQNNKHGPVIISILKEQVDQKGSIPVIIRTQMEDKKIFLTGINFNPKNKYKEALKAVQLKYPELLGKTKLFEKMGSEIAKDLQSFEKKQVIKTIKFGVLYCKENQISEEQMLKNVHGSSGFDEFLTVLGKKIDLKNWEGYSGGLDTKYDSTGKESIYTKFQGVEIMFHVSTLLPFSPDDEQQIERKRHIFNDVVTIVYKEGNTPLDPCLFKSQFTHVVIVVQPIEHSEEKDISDKLPNYRVSVSSRASMGPFGPTLPQPSVFYKDNISNFLLKKLLNAEMAAMSAPVFAKKLQRTRRQLLDEMLNKSYTDEEISKRSNLARSTVPSVLPYTMAILVESPSMTLKTVITENNLVSEVITKLRRKFPGETTNWFLSIDGFPLDVSRPFKEYRSQIEKNGMKLDFKPTAK